MNARYPFLAIFGACLALSGCSDSATTTPGDSGISFLRSWGSKDLLEGQMNAPTAITRDPESGTLYVLDAGSNMVHAFSPQGEFLDRWEIPGYSLWDAGGLAIAEDGDLYITNARTHRVLHVRKDGSVIGGWGSPGTGFGQLREPRGIAVGPDGLLYIGEVRNARIQVFETDGTPVRRWTVSEDGYGFYGGLAVSADGFVYVAVPAKGQVRRFDVTGNVVGDWAAPTENFSVATGPGNDVFLALRNQGVQRYSPTGTLLSSWEPPQDRRGGYRASANLALEADGTSYVLGLHEAEVQVYSAGGSFLRGFGAVWGSSPGQFLQPSGVDIAGDGTVYVGDLNLRRVQQFTSEGVYLDEWVAPDQNVSFYPLDVAGGPGDAVFVASYGEVFRLLPDGSIASILNDYVNGQGIDVDEDGAIWIADNPGHRILAYTPAGVRFVEWGEVGKDPGELWYPTDVAVGGGLVVVTDTNELGVYTRDGQFLRSLRTWPEEDYEATIRRVAMDGAQNVIAITPHEILRIAQNRTVLATWESPPGQTDFSGVSASGAGEIYVTDSANGRVSTFLSAGSDD